MMERNEVKIAGDNIAPLAITQAVVGFEFGQTDETVLNFTKYLSTQLPIGKLHFVHVVPAPQLLDAFYETMAGHFDLKASVLERLEKKIAPSFEGGNVQCTYETTDGNPLQEVLSTAEEKAAELVIIGQKGGRDTHGILAKSLARRAKSNALVVPEKVPNRISKILVPIDFSSHSVQAFQMALALKKRWNTRVEITCLHVFEWPNLSLYNLGRSAESLRDIITQNREKAFEEFIDTYAPLDNSSIPRVLIEKTKPGLAKCIMDFAKEESIDFILMGAKGHSTIERLLMGSVTEKLLSINDSIPTLIVR